LSSSAAMLVAWLDGYERREFRIPWWSMYIYQQ
jgi:hypothetical protein